MEHDIMLAQVIDYTGVKTFKPVEVVVSPPAMVQSGASPVLYLSIAALVALGLAAVSYWQSQKHNHSPNRMLISLMAGLAAGLLVTAFSWPTMFGQPLPFEELGRMGQRNFERLFTPIVTTSGVVGLGVALVLWFVVPQGPKAADQPVESMSVFGPNGLFIAAGSVFVALFSTNVWSGFNNGRR